MKNPKEILITASSDMQDALESGGQAGKDRYWKVVDTALAQLEEYYKPKELLPKVNGEYQCEHIKDKVIRGNCVWCNLTVAEKIIDRLKREITELKATPLEPIDEKELDKVLLEAGVVGDTTRRCLVLAIKAHFGVSKKLELLDKDKIIQILYKFDMSKEDCRIDNAIAEIMKFGSPAREKEER